MDHDTKTMTGVLYEIPTKNPKTNNWISLLKNLLYSIEFNRFQSDLRDSEDSMKTFKA